VLGQTVQNPRCGLTPESVISVLYNSRTIESVGKQPVDQKVGPFAADVGVVPERRFVDKCGPGT